MLVRLIV
ncbi:hypothetical protein F383_35733 [Gossypium arboreum]|nr:hypothetical protein F383_35733 [Gossypium arboreum]